MRELELEQMRAKLRNKLKEQEFNMNAGDKRSNLANFCYLSGNRAAEFSSEQKKCKYLHVWREEAKFGLDECCRTRGGNLEGVTGTKRGDEFRKLGVPLKFTLEINQLSHP
ncbi:hypothetical protein TNCV_3954651 [Trichonephila clavipes]|nr:hypothetical protein TNCV_3954651 [Trichonephila clavipes]